MHVQKIQLINQTSFGTRFGTNLTRFLENNKDVLSGENRRILSTIRKNGIDSVLELEEASVKDKEMYNYKYILTLHSKTIDRKNELMNWRTSLYPCFQDYINGTVNGKVIATNNRFPVMIKDLKENTFIPVIRKFNDSFMLADKIEKEAEQAEIIVKEFDKFKEEWLKKLMRK